MCEGEFLLSSMIWVCSTSPRGDYRGVPYDVKLISCMRETSVFLCPILCPTLALPLSCCMRNGNLDIAWDFSSCLKGVVVGASSSLQSIDIFLQRWARRCTTGGRKAWVQLLVCPRTRKQSGDTRNGLFLSYRRNETSVGARASCPAAAGVERQSCSMLSENPDAFIPWGDQLCFLNWDGCVIGGEAGGTIYQFYQCKMIGSGILPLSARLPASSTAHLITPFASSG